MKKENYSEEEKKDVIDILGLLNQLFKARRFIFRVGLIFGILGVFYAITIPESFRSQTTFISQSDKDSQSSLSGLASLAGIDLGVTSGNNLLDVNFYPTILRSYDFKENLLSSEIRFNNEIINIEEYLRNYGPKTLSYNEVLNKYIFGLPRFFINTVINSKEKKSEQKINEALVLTQENLALFETLDSRLRFSYDSSNGLITLEFLDSNKYVAAEILSNAKGLLQEHLTKIRNQSAKKLYNSVLNQYKQSDLQFQLIQDSLAMFKDQNLNISSSLYQNRLDRLQMKSNIALSITQNLAGQVEQMKLNIDKVTPIFTTIDPITVPFRRAEPNRTYIVITWCLLGIIFSSLYTLSRAPLKEILNLISKT